MIHDTLTSSRRGVAKIPLFLVNLIFELNYMKTSGYVFWILLYSY